MAKLNGKLVTIEGITYRLEMVDDKRDKVAKGKTESEGQRHQDKSGKTK